MKSVDELDKQSKFCLDLMERLNSDILSLKVSEIGSSVQVENHTPVQEDIRRLRRELMTLQKMLKNGGL